MDLEETLPRRIAQRIAYRHAGLNRWKKPYVFGIGLSRTGTTSLNSALGILGFRSFHLPPITRIDGDDCSFVWPWWMNKYDAATDLTVAAVFRDLNRRFPNAKFIYTTRDIDNWLISCEKHHSLNLLEMRVRQKNFHILEICLHI